MFRSTPLTPLEPRADKRSLIGFSIDRSGGVETPRIIDSEPDSIFDEAALTAIRRWRSSPGAENGAPVEQHGLRIAMPFRREDGGS